MQRDERKRGTSPLFSSVAERINDARSERQRRPAMRHARRLVHAVLLTAATVSALADLTVAEAAASLSPSPDIASSALVLRGSPDSTEQDAAASDGGAPTVLRGSPPSAAQPHATPYACNSGLDYDPNYGCVLPGYSYAPDYGYWPDYGYGPGFGFGGFDTGPGRRGFRHGFAHGIGRGRAFRFNHGFAHAGFTHGFAHAGFSHAFAHGAGVGHR
jgi:hypothetical protein